MARKSKEATKIILGSMTTPDGHPMKAKDLTDDIVLEVSRQARAAGNKYLATACRQWLLGGF